MDGQLNLFDIEKTPLAIRNKIYLIELFAGVGSQAMSLRDIGANFVHHKVCEFDKFAIASYNAIHGTDFKPSDIRELKGKDLEIIDPINRTYLLTYLLISVPRPFRSWKTSWNVKGIRYTKWSAMGS